MCYATQIYPCSLKHDIPHCELNGEEDKIEMFGESPLLHAILNS